MKYWAYINNEIKGPFEREELLKLEGFNGSTLVCPQSPVEEETKEWKEASNFPELNFPLDEKKDIESDKTPSANSLPSSKEDVIIERFNNYNVFKETPVDEILKPTTVDPLTLSQIRKSQENILSTNQSAPSTLSTDPLSISKIEKTIETEKEDIKPEKSQEISHKENTIDDIEIPDSDSLISSSNTINRDEIKEIKPEVVEFKQEEPVEIKPVIEEFKTQNLETTPVEPTTKTPEERLEGDRMEDLKKEIVNLVDIRLKEIEGGIALKADIENFKKEIYDYIDEKLRGASSTTRLPPEQSDLINHLDIEVKDLRVKLESIEKKLSENKVVEQKLEREDILGKSMDVDSGVNNQSGFKNLKTPVSDPAKTVIIKREEAEESKEKKFNLKKIFMPVVYLLLFVAVIISILFGLKQFGVFDFTSFISKNKNSTSTNPPASFPSSQMSTTTVNTNAVSSSAINNSVLSDTISLTQNVNISTSTPSGDESGKSSIEEDINFIISEVKEYTLNSGKTLNDTVNSIISSRKGNLRTVLWSAEKKDMVYLIIVKARASGKDIFFKFEYDNKAKILKPLNTLASNTLKMMLIKAKPARKSISKRKVKPEPEKIRNSHLNTGDNHKLQSSEENNNQGDKTPEEKDNLQEDKSLQNTQDNEEYLIIGE